MSDLEKRKKKQQQQQQQILWCWEDLKILKL